jgi:hypothetical protein
LLLTQIARSTSLRLDFSLSRITSATSDVLANFSRLSIFILLVNFISRFSLNFLLNKSSKSDIHSHCANYQNIETLDDERGALGSWKISNQLQWLGFGLLVALRASTAIKRLDCAPSSLYELPYAAKAKVRSSVSLLLT